jgi:hypothetical protein
LVPADLPLATNLVFGAVKPDNTTITISGGVISAVGTGGFPFTLGSTSIGASSTTTAVAGLSVNGVTLNGAGSSSLFLNQAGSYAAPATGFPIILGSTSIASGSTTTSLSGLTVNGVALNSTGSSSLFLTQAGTYAVPSGSGNTTSTSLTTNTIPKANGANSIINSGLTDDGTKLTYTGSGTAQGFQFPEGTAITGLAASDNLWADSTAHRWVMNNNNAGALDLVGIATAGTSGHLVTLAANGIDIQDGGAVPASITSLTGDVTASGPGAAAASVVKVNGLAIPASACAVSTNGSSQFTALTCTGTGNNVLATSPTLTTPNIGVATATSVNGTTIPASVTLTQTICSGTISLGTSAIASGAAATTVTQTCTGLASTDNIQLDFNASPLAVTGYTPSASGMLGIIKWPTTNTINVSVVNNTGASITPGAITLNYRVTR